MAMGEFRPLEEGYCAPGCSIFIGIEEVSMIGVILIHCQLDSSQAHQFSVEATINLLTGGDESDVMETED